MLKYLATEIPLFLCQFTIFCSFFYITPIFLSRICPGKYIKWGKKKQLEKITRNNKQWLHKVVFYNIFFQSFWKSENQKSQLDSDVL